MSKRGSFRSADTGNISFRKVLQATFSSESSSVQRANNVIRVRSVSTSATSIFSLPHDVSMSSCRGALAGGRGHGRGELGGVFHRRQSGEKIVEGKYKARVRALFISPSAKFI